MRAIIFITYTLNHKSGHHFCRYSMRLRQSKIDLDSTYSGSRRGERKTSPLDGRVAVLKRQWDGGNIVAILGSTICHIPVLSTIDAVNNKVAFLFKPEE